MYSGPLQRRLTALWCRPAKRLVKKVSRQDYHQQTPPSCRAIFLASVHLHLSDRFDISTRTDVPREGPLYGSWLLGPLTLYLPAAAAPSVVTASTLTG
ncbi:hypothetical protein INR49_002110 [Caranx melampygus]|nr:hypothetical protein INR49_002110 [Caranx melampygus]